MRILNEQEAAEQSALNPVAKGIRILAIFTIVGGFSSAGLSNAPLPALIGIVSGILLIGVAEIIKLLQKLCDKTDIVIANLSALNLKDTDVKQE